MTGKQNTKNLSPPSLNLHKIKFKKTGKMLPNISEDSLSMTNFPQHEHITSVVDPAVVVTLDEELCKQLQDNIDENTSLSGGSTSLSLVNFFSKRGINPET